MAKVNNTKNRENYRKDNTELKEKASKVLHAVDDNRKTIIVGIVCFLLATLLFRCILWPDRIATLKDGTQPIVTVGDKIITADDMYEKLRTYSDGEFSFSVILDEIDKIVLEKIYPDDKESYESAKKEIDAILTNTDYLNYYGSEQNILSQMGASTREEAYQIYKLRIQRENYFNDYVESTITDNDIENYYKNNVTGDVDTKHILVSVKSANSEDGLNDADAKKMAEEIIKKLNKGTSWDDVIAEYKDNIITEELGYQAFNATLEESYLKEMKALKVGSYSKKPVKTSYGYHIVYKIDEKEKPKLEDVKDAIVETIATDKKNKDTSLQIKALTDMREKDGLSFSDTTYESKYKEYLKNK